MKINALIIVFSLCYFGLAAQNKGGTQQDVIRQMFEVNYPNYVKAGDAQGYASQYTADAVWMTPDGPTQTGPKAIENFIGAVFQQADLQPTIKVEEIEITGKWAYVVGAPSLMVKPKNGDQPTNLDFRVIWIVRKAGKDWKIARQLWNVIPQ